MSNPHTDIIELGSPQYRFKDIYGYSSSHISEMKNVNNRVSDLEEENKKLRKIVVGVLQVLAQDHPELVIKHIEKIADEERT
jgi:hypothetical protein